MNPASLDPWTSETIGYESLIADMLVTKSLLFSVVGLDSSGRHWVEQLTAYGYATVAVDVCDGDGHPEANSSTWDIADDGMLRLGASLEEIRGSDVIIHASGVPNQRQIRALNPHFKRGQVLCCPCESRPDPETEREIRSELAFGRRAVGVDLFLIYLPSVVMNAPTVPMVIPGMSAACSRVGTALYQEVLADLAG